MGIAGLIVFPSLTHRSLYFCVAFAYEKVNIDMRHEFCTAKQEKVIILGKITICNNRM